ncbi:hypothetical protein Mbo2_074 [Rhodococcus phage Mbo2]|uniref:Uncharacterized protein n=1 Tax=Rhodococcus phage Mbo2 TaxID=2936911 RepID=A0A9E7IEI0_9CAUD|nr:hypothetical protein Mbo2_074 [Rhodococcus phage Mbo2]
MTLSLFGDEPEPSPEPKRTPRKAPAKAAPKPKKLTAKQQRLMAPEAKTIVAEDETFKALRALAEAGILHPDEIAKRPDIFAERIDPQLKQDLANWRERHAHRDSRPRTQ